MKEQRQKVPFLFCIHRLYIKLSAAVLVLSRSQKEQYLSYGCFRSMELTNMMSKNFSKR